MRKSTGSNKISRESTGRRRLGKLIRHASVIYMPTEEPRSLPRRIIAYLHRPWYVSVEPPTYPAWQQAFEQIFYDNEVDMYMQGHVHVYERIKPSEFSSVRRVQPRRSTRRRLKVLTLLPYFAQC